MARQVWLAGGIIAFLLGTIGIALPLLPTVPFYLLAAFCWTRSHPAWAEQLYNHPRHGLPLRQWRDRRAISRRAKYLAITTMAAGAGITWFALGFPATWISLAVLAICGSWIATRAE